MTELFFKCSFAFLYCEPRMFSHDHVHSNPESKSDIHVIICLNYGTNAIIVFMGKCAHTYSLEATQLFLQGLFWFQTSDNKYSHVPGRATFVGQGTGP